MSLENVPTLSNRSERLPCVLVVDASSSMRGNPINELNAGLKILETDLKANDEAKRRVRVMVVQVSDGSATKIVDWVDAENFSAPVLAASGGTPLGGGVRMALAEIKVELQKLKDQGIARKKPWLWLFTDGEPTDENWETAAVECRTAHLANEVLVYPIAVGPNADVKRLGTFSKDNNVYQIDATSFQKLFQFISGSAITQSARAGEPTVTPLFSQISG